MRGPITLPMAEAAAVADPEMEPNSIEASILT